MVERPRHAEVRRTHKKANSIRRFSTAGSEAIVSVCGSSPSLSEIQGKEGARRLRCGLCGAGWRYPHLKCAFCQNGDYKLLSNLTVEGEEEQYRIVACEVCHGYIKVVKTFEPIPVDMLPVHDLATLHLDLIAAEHGYTCLTAS
jgi:FdhE protein